MSFDMDVTLISPVDLHTACWTEALKHIGADIPPNYIRVWAVTGGD